MRKLLQRLAVLAGALAVVMLAIAGWDYRPVSASVTRTMDDGPNPCKDLVNMYSKHQGFLFGFRPWMKTENLEVHFAYIEGHAKYAALQNPMVQDLPVGAQYSQVRWRDGTSPDVLCLAMGPGGLVAHTSKVTAGPIDKIPWPGGCDTQLVPDCDSDSGSGGSGGTGGGDTSNLTCYWSITYVTSTGEITNIEFLGCW